MPAYGRAVTSQRLKSSALTVTMKLPTQMGSGCSTCAQPLTFALPARTFRRGVHRQTSRCTSMRSSRRATQQRKGKGGLTERIWTKYSLSYVPTNRSDSLSTTSSNSRKTDRVVSISSCRAKQRQTARPMMTLMMMMMMILRKYRIPLAFRHIDTLQITLFHS